MTDGANSKFFSRFVALLFIGLAFAGCAAMIAQSDKSLFTEVSATEMAPKRIGAPPEFSLTASLRESRIR